MSEPVDSVAMSAADCGKSGQVPVMALESMVRDAFAWRGRCEDLSPRQIADAYENLSLLDDAGVMELLMRAGAALILCEMWGFLGACWASPLAWIGSAIPLMIAYYWTRRSFRHKMVGIEG